MSMRLRSVLVLLAVSVLAFAGAVKPADEKDVMAAEKQYADAMIAGDASMLGKLLADDLSYTHSSALQEDKAAVIKSVTSGKTKYTAIDFKTSKARQFGNTVITNHEMLFTQPDHSTKVYVTMVWVKSGSGWQLVQRQATKLPE